MADYRIYRIDSYGRIVNVAYTNCSTDLEACALAERPRGPGERSEVWAGNRCVAQYHGASPTVIHESVRNFADTPPDPAEPMETGRDRPGEPDRRIGKRLRFIRRLSSLSLDQVASGIDISPERLRRYEEGSNRLSAILLHELSQLFQLPMEWFLEPRVQPLNVERSRSFSNLMDQIYRSVCNGIESEWDHALDLVCHTVKIELVPSQTRLLRLRRALSDSGPEAKAAFLDDATNSLAGPGRKPTQTRNEGRLLIKSTSAVGVLVVDDDPDVLRLLSGVLTSAGFVVSTAASGDDALLAVTTNPVIRAIVTDYAMVGMDGIELMLQARQHRPEIPGIVISGFADSRRLLDLPPNIEVLSKPFGRDELISRLRSLTKSPISIPTVELKLRMAAPSLTARRDDETPRTHSWKTARTIEELASAGRDAPKFSHK